MVKRNQKLQGTFGYYLRAFFFFWDNKMFVVEMTKQGPTVVVTVDSTTFNQAKNNFNQSINSEQGEAGFIPGLSSESKVLMQIYRVMMLVAAMMVCLGHGSNDVANAISPFLEVLSQADMNSNIAYLTGSFGIALGLMCLGYKVMETVGKKVVKLDFAKGFSAQFATAMSINLGTVLGLPLSTTHCMVGALFGILIISRLSLIKEVYGDLDEDENT